MPRTFYTIDDLVTFCKMNNFSSFSSKEHDDKPLIVQSVETFEVTDNSKDGLMPVHLKACHIGKNRNQSCIDENVMKRNMTSFKGRPILGSIIQADTGEYEFHSHDMNFTEDGEVEYIEQPVGVISQLEEPYLEYDEDEDKTYLHVNGHIFTEYSRAAEILERRKTCKCSVEIAVHEISWNCEEDCLSIDSFTFMGVTILGYEQDGVTEIKEGMKGSNITIDSFSAKENSMFIDDYSNKIVDLLSVINTKLDSISNKQFNEKGVEITMSHFEELLEKYGKTIEDIDFDYNDMSDEDLDAMFTELFDETEGEPVGEDEGDSEQDPIVVEETEETDPVDTEEDDVDDGVSGKKKLENSEIKYELSHDDIRTALYNLVGMKSEDGYYCVWIAEVYDNKFIYENYSEGKYYRQKYSKDGDNIALDGDPVEVFNEWLSKDEKDALDALKADYAALKSFKETYDAEQVKATKNEIFKKAEYIDIKESEGFKQLMCDMDQYSVDEIQIKADLLFAEYAKTKLSFSAEESKDRHSVGMKLDTKPSKKRAYASLFDE